jgi:hypothetical protein
MPRRLVLLAVPSWPLAAMSMTLLILVALA